MIDIRLPNITGETAEEQLSQFKSYLYQMVEQLNWHLNDIETHIGRTEEPGEREMVTQSSVKKLISENNAELISVKNIQLVTPATLAPGEWTQVYLNINSAGYTPIGVVGFHTGSAHVLTSVCRIEEGKVRIAARNEAQTAQPFQPSIRVLLLKN